MALSHALYGALLQGDEAAARDETERLLNDGIAATVILNDVCIPAIVHVRQSVDDGDLYLPDLFISQRAYQTALETLRPHLSAPAYAQALTHGEFDATCFL